MNAALWVLAGLLAAAFLAAGALKLSSGKATLEPKMPWVEDFTDAQVRGIGAVEILGALGLVLPAALDIAPGLVPVAALGLAMTMAGAVIVHLRHGDGPAAAIPSLVLGVLALLLALGRFGPEPF